MKRQHFAGLLLSTFIIFSAGQAIAITGTPIVQKVHLRGVMPLTRIIYIDRQEHVLSVVTNTDQNVTPIVALQDTVTLRPMSPNINDQYQSIVAANGGHLGPGTYFPVAPSYGGWVIKTSLNL